VLGISGLALVDAAIFVTLGYFIKRRYSSVAAVLAMLMYVAEIIYQYEHGSSHPSILTVLFLLYLFHGIRGTFAYADFQSRYETAQETPAP
jgi:hypothetical protein